MSVQYRSLCVVSEKQSPSSVIALQIFSEETFGPAVPLFKVNFTRFATGTPAMLSIVPLAWRSMYNSHSYHTS